MYIDELLISTFVKGIYNNWLNRKYEELEERAKKDEFSSFFEFEREFERLRQDYEVIEYHHLKVNSSHSKYHRKKTPRGQTRIFAGKNSQRKSLQKQQP